MPPDACGGARFVLAVCPPGVEASRAAQDNSSLLLRFQSEAEVPPPVVHVGGGWRAGCWVCWVSNALSGVASGLGRQEHPEGNTLMLLSPQLCEAEWGLPLPLSLISN